LGQAIGGSGVLFLAPHVGFSNTYWFAAGFIALITLTVSLPLREPRPEPRPRGANALAAVAGEIRTFVVESARSFVGTRAAWMGVIFALLPAGAYALGLALQSNLAVELGMNDTQVASINLWTAILSALGCVAGGWL